jgi:hypothetical protein
MHDVFRVLVECLAKPSKRAAIEKEPVSVTRTNVAKIASLFSTVYNLG